MFDSWKIDSQGAAGFSRNRYLLATFGAVASAFAAMLVLAGGASAASVTPTPVDGNPSCQDRGYDFGFKIEVPPDDESTPDVDESELNINGTYPFKDDAGPPKTELTGGAPEDLINSVTISNYNGTTFDWTSTLGIDAVIVKGGNEGANSYVYDPPAESKGDTNLTTPTGQGISHIEFCYDYEVDVSKTANASFDRTYDWDIAKSNDGNDVDDPAVVNAGSPFEVDYEVTVSGLGSVDSNWAVGGTITIENNTPLPSTITSVDDVIQKGNPPVDVADATVDCGVTFPYNLAAFDPNTDNDKLVCTYDKDGFAGDNLPDNNHVDVTTSGTVGGDSANAPINWDNASITEIDECVDVTDTYPEFAAAYPGAAATVCAGDSLPKTFTYSKTFTFSDPEDCGVQSPENTASFVREDTGTPGEPLEGDTSTSTVNILVLCEGDDGCTLTPGYWKTHSSHGPARADDGWAQITPNGADTAFYTPAVLSGKTYHQVLWTAPQGNAYYILAHAYIAAKLNVLNGASSTPAVDAAITFAQSFFGTKGPNSSLTKTYRQQVLANALTLDNYNNGIIGPGHCTDDGSSA
jgi:hypothetical protein